MSDSDKSLKISIQVDAATAISEQERYNAKLKEMAKLTEGAAKADKEQASANTATARSTQESYRVEEKAAETTKLFTGQKKALSTAIKGLAADFPIAGIALRFLANPLAAFITLATTGFVMIKRHVDEFNRELDAIGERAAKPIGDMKESLFEATRAVAESERKIAAWREGLADVAGKEKEMFDHAITKIHEEIAATNELIAAREKAGLISPETAAAQTKSASELGAAEELRVRQQQLGTAKTNKSLLERQESAAEAVEKDRRKVALEINKGKTETQLTDEIKKIREGDDLKKAKAKLEEIEKQYGNYNEAVGLDRGAENKQNPNYQPRQSQKGKIGDIETQMTSLENLRVAIQRGNLEIEKAHAKAEEIRSKISALTTTISTLENQIGDAQEKVSAKQKVKAQNEVFKNVSRSPLGAAAIENINEGISTADKFVDRKPVGQAEAGKMVSIASELAGSKVDLRTAVAMMETAKTHKTAYDQDVLRLVAIMGDMLKEVSPIARHTQILADQVEQLKKVNKNTAARIQGTYNP